MPKGRSDSLVVATRGVLQMSKGLGSFSSLARALMLQGNVRVLAFTSMVTGIYVSMLSTVLQPFVVLGLGFGLPVLGALQSVGGRPSGLASSIVQPFAGILADLVGRRQLIIAGSLVSICSMISFLVAALSHSLVSLAAGFLLFGLSMLSSPASQATIAESVPMELGKVGVAFSVVFFFTQLPGAFAPFAAGYVAESFGYYTIFAAAAILESANLLVLSTQLNETGSAGREAPSPRPRFSLESVVLLPPGFLRIFTPFAMDAFAFGLVGSTIYGMWAKQFGLSTDDIGLIVGTLYVSVLVCQYPAARLLLKVGPRLSLAFSELLTVVVLLGWAVTVSVPALVALSAVFGASIATWVPALQSLLMSSAPPEQRGSIGGKLAAFRGLIAFPAPIVGGLLFQAYGYHLPVTLSLAGEAVTVIAILRLLPETLRRRSQS